VMEGLQQPWISGCSAMTEVDLAAKGGSCELIGGAWCQHTV
jgi:hypothetical protein